MNAEPLQDLQISRRAGGLCILLFAVLSATFLMAGSVAAVDGHGLLFLGSVVGLTVLLTLASNQGYRLRQTKYGRVQVHSLMRVRELDLSAGFDVKEGPVGLRVKTPRRKARLLGVGGPVLVREWLEVAASR